MPNKQAKREREQARKEAKRRRTLLKYAAVVSTAAIVVGVSYFWLSRTTQAIQTFPLAKCDAVETVPDEGNAHLNLGETYKYQTNPPASGPHNPEPWPAGIYNVPILAIREVHSLEHGYVIIHYNGISSNDVEQLASLVRADSWKMILSPLPTMPYKISLTAWDHVQTCEGINTPVIRSFVNQFRDRGPEQTPM